MVVREDISSSQSVTVNTVTLNLKAELVKLQVDENDVSAELDIHYGEECRELRQIILTDFLNTLVEHDEFLTSSAFMHRCYLRYARKHYRTNAKINVVKSVDMFKSILRNLASKYEVVVNGRSKGWKLGVPK